MQSDIGSVLQTAASLKCAPPFYEGCRTALIYGAGNVGMAVLRAMNSRGIQTTCFLDKKAVPGAQCDGLPIYPPEWDDLTSTQKQQTPIVIAIHNRDVEVPPIVGYLRSRGYGRIVTLVEFYDHFHKEMGDRFWLTSRLLYKAWEEPIRDGYETWEDEHSRQIYLSLLRFRLTGSYSDLPSLDTDRQYFPSSTPAWRTPLRLVDGGAFDGDTLRSAIDSQYPLESAVVFEPDPTSFHKLAECVSGIAGKEIHLWPCGVYSSTTQLGFDRSASESSRLHESRDATIQTVALDDVIPHFRPNLIKLDIEGAEYQALLGAKRVILENRPGLAVCLYHRPEDMWQIPLLIKKWGLGYSLFMRAHRHNDFEVVLYAVA